MELTTSSEVKSAIKLATTGVPVKQIQYADLLSKFSVLIANTHISTGVAYDAQLNERSAIPRTIEGMVLQYGYLTFAEIEAAFKMGWMPDAPKYYGLCEKTYYEWAEAYAKSETRSNAKKTIQKAKELLLKNPAELTDGQKDEIIKEAMLIAFRNIKEKKSLVVIPSVWYDYLYRAGLISYSPELIDSFKAQAKTQLENEKLAEKFESPRFSARIHEYISKLSKEHEDVVARGKQIAVRFYFVSLLEMGEELSDYLAKK